MLAGQGVGLLGSYRHLGLCHRWFSLDQFGAGAPGFAMRIQWSVKVKCISGSSTFGMWHVTQSFAPTGHARAERSGVAASLPERWQARHFAS